jgi:hypothetical protein
MNFIVNSFIYFFNKVKNNEINYQWFICKRKD